MSRWRDCWIEAWRTDRLWLGMRLLVACLWAVELFWVQSLSFQAVPWMRFPSMVQLFRFYLDLLLVGGLVLLVRRRVLIALLVASLCVFAVIGAYAANYHWPLMPVRAYYQWREAWSLRGEFHQILPWKIAVILLLAGVLKSVLLLKSGNRVLPARVRYQTAAVLLALAAVPILGLQFTHLRFNIGPSGGYGRMVFTYGYSLPWCCEIIANSDAQKHADRARGYLAHHYDRLTPVEAPLPPSDRFAVLQLESFDASALAAAWNNAPVMPFFQEIKCRSMYFRLNSFHRNGSCDMDYAATTCVEPYPGVDPYRLPGMPYTNAMPAFARQHGFKSFFFHGNTAIFYDRGPVINRLGFDQAVFKEQLQNRGLPESMIGFRDSAMLDQVLAALRSEQRAYTFLITLDTHTPFQQLRPEENEIFPAPGSPTERYFNALRYLDNSLRDFIARVPEGTTVIMYGDHAPPTDSGYFQPDVVNGQPYVACLIYQKGSNLAQIQKTRKQPISSEGTLNLLDILNYVRHSIDLCSAPKPENRGIQKPMGGSETTTLANDLNGSTPQIPLNH